MVARSSSCVSEAKPVIDLIIADGTRQRAWRRSSYAFRLLRRFGRFLLQLQFIEFRIRAAPREQFVVAARFDDAPALQDDDGIGPADGRQAVGDDKRRA